jgi:hypothetical protein
MECGISKLVTVTHVAEHFLRSRQLCSYSRISEHFMEPKGSLPHSKEFTLSDTAFLGVTKTRKKLGLIFSLYPWAGYQFNSTAPTSSLYCQDATGFCLLNTNLELIKKFQNKCF